MILKSDNSNPVDHAGTTVYVREHAGGVQIPQLLPRDDTAEVIIGLSSILIAAIQYFNSS